MCVYIYIVKMYCTCVYNPTLIMAPSEKASRGIKLTIYTAEYRALYWKLWEQENNGIQRDRGMGMR